MNKKILLVEPSYRTKYPPLGLMKISTYHKMKGDEVVFVKGRDTSVQYQYWDRVYIGTLFTWTWKETVDTIRFYTSTLFSYTGKCFVGGILASLLPDDLFNATGIQPIEGLLDHPRKIDQDDEVIIDELPPDYDILKQVESNNFRYSNTDAYLGYSTRGCIRKCKFCAVRTFEPEYIPYVDVKKMAAGVQAQSGEKQNLVLLDNNVLASSCFNDIIDDIKEMGFVKGATFGPTRRKRIVDFNQGLDARLLDDDKMKRLAEIPLEPMRLAFDSIGMKRSYVKAVRLANRHGQKEMSNYVLYNFDDRPEDFYERLRINVELNEEFASSQTRTEIYSFPMRYIPLSAKHRNVDTGNHYWNKRFLRSVQMILNVMKGPVMPGKRFFLQAFGRDEEEFRAIISMPELFIKNRLVPEWRDIDTIESRWMSYVAEWMNRFKSLSNTEKEELTSIIGSDDKAIVESRYSQSNGGIRRLLEYHLREEDIVATR